MIDTAAVPETAVLVGIVTKGQTEAQAKEYLDELEFLALTAGAVTKKYFVQNLEHPHPKTFLGSGKIKEVEEYVRLHDIDTVIFDDELSPSQLRNIERIFERKILDRNNLILDIFAARAQTHDAKTQVELAQYQYILPRLTRMWTHLDRQKGGGIGLRGPGETQIETDRRIIQQKIALLKEKLVKIDRQKSVQRGNRGAMVRVALVGYTNVGKSTIMNMLSKSKVFAEDKLFATLDTTVRKVVLQNLPFLMSDTVGFIRKLPHQLVESFKSTLDEVREADILIHVVDISHPNFQEQIDVVKETLADLNSSDKRTILVFNKIDNYTFIEENEETEFDFTGNKELNYSLETLKKMWMTKNDDLCLFISAINKENIEEFRALLYEEVKKVHIERFPYNNFLYEVGE
ncbi:MAG: GTPase HflX [Flavobacteriales bacterium]|nr:GTPase HflX [Flavobacteriales bacterium]